MPATLPSLRASTSHFRALFYVYFLTVSIPAKSPFFSYLLFSYCCKFTVFSFPSHSPSLTPTQTPGSCQLPPSLLDYGTAHVSVSLLYNYKENILQDIKKPPVICASKAFSSWLLKCFKVTTQQSYPFCFNKQLRGKREFLLKRLIRRDELGPLKTGNCLSSPE